MHRRGSRGLIRTLAIAVAATAAALLVAGCGGGASTATPAARPPPATAAARQPAAAAGTGRKAAERRMAAIVHAWSDRLDAGDFKGIARLFALPAILIQGRDEYRLPTRHDVELWHSLLPCGGKILSITYSGRFATAVFRLSNRGTTKCDAPGSLAAARFEIVRSKIVEWEQVAVPEAKPAAPIA